MPNTQPTTPHSSRTYVPNHMIKPSFAREKFPAYMYMRAGKMYPIKPPQNPPTRPKMTETD